MSFGDGIFRALVVAACFGLLYGVCLLCQRLSERPRGGLPVEHGQRSARRRRGAALMASLVLLSSGLLAAPVFVWPGISVLVSATLVGCALTVPLVVLSRLAGSRPGVAVAGWLACSPIIAATLWLLGGSMIATGTDADRLEQDATLVAVRELGEAFERWQLDQTASPGPQGDGERAPFDRRDFVAGAASTPGLAERVIVRWDELPPLSADELESRLVPRYLRFLPVSDGWGRPLEIRGALGSSPRLAIRSAGRDGEYASDVYRAGTFDQAAFDEDIVWVDGIFVRQPE